MGEQQSKSGELILRPIAKIFTDFPTKFGIPRQSGLAEGLEAEVVFEPEFRNPAAVRGLEEYSYIWLIWEFSQSVRQGWSATVRPPRLGGNERVGVFATRSPYRPNPLGTVFCTFGVGVPYEGPGTGPEGPRSGYAERNAGV